MGQSLQYLKPLTSPDEIQYPESDGKPMGETDFHISAIMYLLSALRYYFKNAADVYVASDMLLYHEEGNPNAFVVPDVFIAKGVDKRTRRTFKVWEEKAIPVVVFEITSRGTRLEDLATKRGLYQLLEVKEYFLFDPLDEYLSPRLQGFRLEGSEYRHVELDEHGNLFSRELGLTLQPDDKLLRVVDSTTEKVVPTLDEAMLMVKEETRRADSAEAELARLRDEIERLYGKNG